MESPGPEFVSFEKTNLQLLSNIFFFYHFCSGNVVGQQPYTPGTPCTKCASGQGWCYKNLCSEYKKKVNREKWPQATNSSNCHA